MKHLHLNVSVTTYFQIQAHSLAFKLFKISFEEKNFITLFLYLFSFYKLKNKYIYDHGVLGFWGFE